MDPNDKETTWQPLYLALGKLVVAAAALEEAIIDLYWFAKPGDLHEMVRTVSNMAFGNLVRETVAARPGWRLLQQYT